MMVDDMDSDESVHVDVGDAILDGDLTIPPRPRGLVLFVHGSGSSRHSPRNRLVAARLRTGRLATLLIDLLTEPEEAIDQRGGVLRFDTPLLARRVVGITDWLTRRGGTRDLPIGYFGASTGGGAALLAAAGRDALVRAVVSRGGRPDLAGAALERVAAPTLLIVGGRDAQVLALNRVALAALPLHLARLEVIPGAGHLFEEPGALELVADLARAWFETYLGPPRTTAFSPGAPSHG